MKNDFEKTADWVKEATKKQMFDVLYMGGHTALGSTIFMFVKDCSSTFCADIASRAFNQYLNNNRVNISEKQAWCLVFDVLKNIHMIDAWVEEMNNKNVD